MTTNTKTELPTADAYNKPFVDCPECDTIHEIDFDAQKGCWAEEMVCHHCGIDFKIDYGEL